MQAYIARRLLSALFGVFGLSIPVFLLLLLPALTIAAGLLRQPPERDLGDALAPIIVIASNLPGERNSVGSIAQLPRRPAQRAVLGKHVQRFGFAVHDPGAVDSDLPRPGAHPGRP